MYPKGKRRNNCNAQKFIKALGQEFSYIYISKLLGVSDRTVRRWASGEDYCDSNMIFELVDKMFPCNGGLPIYSPDMQIDGNTRTVGVGEYSIHSARGDMEYVRNIVL